MRKFEIKEEDVIDIDNYIKERNNIKKNIKELIYSVNFLERKIDYSNRVIFYKINIKILINTNQKEK